MTYRILRGSIPLLWTQFADYKYTPEIRFSEKGKINL
jgi:hypothetical protein